MSKWKEWKEAQGETRPWHMFDPSKKVEDFKMAEDRLSICKVCPEFINLTYQCKKCLCVMTLKTQLQEAKCPIGKW